MASRSLVILLLAAVLPAAATDNLLQNASMESWHASGLRADGWGVWTPQKLRHTWSVHPERDMVRDGAVAMRVTVGDWANVFSGAPARAGETYTFSCYVRCDRAATIRTFFSAWGPEIAKGQGGNQQAAQHDLAPDTWTRVHVTTTLPAGTERVTTYMNIRGAGNYIFDKAMMNVGELAEFTPGPPIRKLAPHGRVVLPGEVAWSAHSWDADGKDLTDQEVAFAFDSDVMSIFKPSAPTPRLPKRIGAVFSGPVQIRGLSVLLATPAFPEDVEVALAVKRDGQWRQVAHKLIQVGAIQLLSIPPQRVSGVRLELTARGEQPVKCPDIYHMAVAQ
jgi:hypothetical protein